MKQALKLIICAVIIYFIGLTMFIVTISLGAMG